MSPRKPNMLEAFQHSAQLDKTRQAVQRAHESAGEKAGSSSHLGAGGPFDAGAGRPTSVETTPANPGSASLPNQLGDDILGTGPRRARRLAPRGALLTFGILAAMVLMFQLGRKLGSNSETAANAAVNTGAGAARDELPEAGEGDGATMPDTDPQSPPLDTSQPAKDSELTDDDRAFLDKSNNWTVIAISFDDNVTGKGLALETYRHLRSEGLPAIKPITQGDFLTICVGAEPSRNEAIEKIRATLQRLPGPPPRNEKGAFSSAYFANIEDQVDPQIRR